MKRTSIDKMPPIRLVCGGHFINDGCESDQLTVGGAFPGLVVLACIFKRQARQATESQSVGNIFLWFLLQFLP